MESSMEFRQVGKSGLRVSAMGLGCNPFGAEVDAPTAQAIIDRAIDAGIGYFDTADSYNAGRSEELLANALGTRRTKVIIATKFANRMGSGPNDLGTSRHHIIEACEASLRRLKTDYIDVYQVHTPDRAIPIAETMRALDDLVSQGKVRYLGASNFWDWEICEAQWTADKHSYTPFSLTQIFYNLLYRDAEKSMIPFCVKYGIGINCYFPLAGALLTGTYRRGTPPPEGSRGARRPTFKTWDSDRNWSVQEQLLDFAQKRGISLPQLALAWLLTRPQVATVIPGADTVVHLENNIKALEVKLTAEDLTEIDRLTLVDEDRTIPPIYRISRPERLARA
jgi:aryl-alcohol dehydrogenase-like predicted oxidoreductase